MPNSPNSYPAIPALSARPTSSSLDSISDLFMLALFGSCPNVTYSDTLIIPLTPNHDAIKLLAEIGTAATGIPVVAQTSANVQVAAIYPTARPIEMCFNPVALYNVPRTIAQTYFHELAHVVGVPTFTNHQMARLGARGKTYAKEEITAEATSHLLVTLLDIPHHPCAKTYCNIYASNAGISATTFTAALEEAIRRTRILFPLIHPHKEAFK